MGEKAERTFRLSPEFKLISDGLRRKLSTIGNAASTIRFRRSVQSLNAVNVAPSA